MDEQVGGQVVSILEAAGLRFLDPVAPGTFRVFLHHLGASATFQRYEAGPVYWRRLQILLDTFFSAEERAEICSELVARLPLVGRPESYDFLAEALAERRLQETLRTLSHA